MRRHIQFIRIGLLLALFGFEGVAATNTAALHLFDRHIWVEKGESRVLGQVIAELVFSSIVDFDDPNGEWVYLEDVEGIGQHNTILLLTDPTVPGFPGWIGQLLVELPLDVDQDEDGIPDFHQVSQAVNASTEAGYFEISDPLDPVNPIDDGSVRVAWTRSAGAHRGTCVITLEGSTFITAPLAFTHAFEIAEYEGTYAYVPSPDLVVGELDVTRIGYPDQQMRGELVLEPWQDVQMVNGADIVPSTFVNSLAREFSLDTGYIEYSAEFPVEYFGGFFWSDNDIETSTQFGLGTFFIGIDDSNDYEADGIPDLTDPPPDTAPFRLTVNRSGADYALAIEGELGGTFQLQMKTSLTGGSDWSIVESITLTNSPQAVPLAIPDTASAFWRLVAAP
jgi:hypothetical protein